MRYLTLRTRLGLLVMAGVLPLLAVNLTTIYLGFREDRARAGNQALDLARSLAHAVQGELRAGIATAEVLALSGTLMTTDLAAFRKEVETVIAYQLPGASILLVREDGQQVMNTALPPGVPLPMHEDWATLQRVFTTGRPAVSDLYFAALQRRPMVSIAVPVWQGDGSLVLILVLNPALDSFSTALSRQTPGQGWVISLLDRAGLRVARAPDAERLIGQRVAEDLLRLPAAQPEGVFETRSLDGIPLIAGFRRLDAFGWTVTVGTPFAPLTGAAWRRAVTALLVGLGVMALGLGLARWVARGVLDPITALRLAAAGTEAAGPAPAATGLPEVDEVAGALLTETRRRRTALASLLDSERRLRLVVAELNHRAKNVLATVQALAQQTARGEADPTRFIATFTARLQGLARAHDLLTAAAWEAAAPEAVLRAGLGPWLGEASDGRPAITIDCGRARELPPVSPGQAQALVLALHELATNAVRHGALSSPEGQVAVTCHGVEEGQGVAIDWRESGGPPVPGTPPRRGFGLRLLERALTHDLGAGSQVTLAFHRTGLCASIRFRARAAQEGEVRAAAVSGEVG